FEIFSFELRQGYSFDRAQPLQRSRDGSITSQESGIAARMRFNPSRDFTLDGRAVWSTLFDGLASTSVSAGADFGRVDLDLTWFTRYDPELGEKESDQARLSARLEILPRRLQLAANVNYNIETSQVQQQRYFLSWTSQCWSAVLEAREQVTASYTSRDYRFLLNLKNIGTFLDLNGGEATDR
ncbi:MAG TPA: hypothetical protein VLA66_09125, partial [Thermoanaerobaculia bacterium]|nr:hypothetical protein [Thermoanaerobaculia bacterium]